MNPVRALLLTDVVDSTRLTEEIGDARMAALWTAHDRIARDLLPLWRGREIDKTDGMLLLFEAVADAVGYALAYHRALAAAQLPLRARAGIHVGPISLRPNPPDDVARGAKPVEVDGLALPIAARVMSVAMGAQTLLSADARLALGVAAQRVVSHGHWRMHGVADPVELFEIGEADAPFAAPPDGTKVYRVVRQGDLWQPVREVRHSVPAERDSFVGRQDALQLIAKKLEDGARLISVLGIGGTGKTRLVTRFAWTKIGDYPGGVWFCDLSQARTVDGIFFAVAQGLDVPLGKTAPVVQLAHAIAGRGECLVILDNFEQVARHAEETLGQWLERAPQARFIVTTREVLGIVGEETLALAPLGSTDAAALFCRRAEAVHQGYAPGSEDEVAITQLVKVLDGLPLAIELAAARVRTMSPRVLLGRMNERFKILLSRGGRQDRQSTLRAAFDWSWELLTEAERKGLAQLSVFVGGFSLGGAEAVIDAEVAPQALSALDIVELLVNKSLVRQVREDRFALLESVRDYAAQHLVSEAGFKGSGPQAQVQAEERHGRHFSTRRADYVAAAEIENIVAACQRATRRRDIPTSMATFELAWEALALTGPFGVALDLANMLRAIEGLAAIDRARVDQIAGRAQILSGRPADARRLLESAHAVAREAGDLTCETRALAALSELDANEGHAQAALHGYEAALSQAQTTGDKKLECAILNGLGTVHSMLEQFDRSSSCYEAALEAARQAKSLRWEGGTLGNLGQFYASHGETERAVTLLEEALEIARTLKDHQWEGNVLCNLGLLNHALGASEPACRCLEASLEIAQLLGYAFLESVVRCNLGMANEARGRASEASTHYESALAIAGERGDKRLSGQIMGYLGLLEVRCGRIDAGRALLAEGTSILRSLSDRVSLGVILCAAAQAAFLTGECDAGRQILKEATNLGIATRAGPSSELGLALRAARRCLDEVAA